MSSSGHLVLLESILNTLGYHIPDLQQIFCNFSGTNVSIDILFNLLHGPTMLVVAVFFFNEWFFLLRYSLRYYKIILKIILLTGIVDFITVLFFLLFKLFPSLSIPLGIGFCITGIILYSLRWCKEGIDHFDWKKALILGCIQGCALLPGISRLATTYVGARWLGLPVRKAFQISWLVQWPLICAAFTHGMYILTSNKSLLYTFLNWEMLLTLIVASICAYVLLSIVNSLVNKNKLWWFSLYMPVPVFVWLIFYR